MKITWALAISLGLIALPSLAAGQDLSLTGLDGRRVAVSSSEFSAMPHVSLTVTVEGKTHTYAGVPLTQLLGRVGAPAGKDLKGVELSDVALVSAKDGYVVALSLAETDPMVRKDQIILADSADGGPLPEGVGPYRLVVEGDQRGARLAREVVAIDLRRLAPSASK